MTRMIAFALAALAIAGAAAPSALAETKTSSARVSYSDLDLSSADGARTMLARLEAASRQACGYGKALPLMDHVALRSCVKQSMSNAVARLNAPMVSALLTESKSFRMASR